MLIISKFRDYYDSALAGGVDKTIVYRRKQKKLEAYPEYLSTKGHEVELTRTHRGIVHTIHVRQFAVAFCGTIYYGARIEKPTRSYTTPDHRDYCYTWEQYQKAIKGYDHPKGSGYRGWGRSKRFTESHFFSRVEPRLIDDRIIIAYSMPDSYGRCENITLNANLGAVKFFRVFDSYAALQEIMMYISGVIGTGEKNTIKISDKDMRDAKGFDEWSFKNPTRVKDIR